MDLSQLLLSTDAGSQEEVTAVPDILSVIRQHLRMDVAFVSEFQDGRRVFRHVDAADPNSPIRAGNGDPLEDSYCQRVVDGRLPALMTDARENEEAATLPVTHALPVGAHIALPIRLSDGSLYGTFCAFSYSANKTLNERDLEMMSVFAALAGRMVDRERSAAKSTRDAQDRIRSVLDSNVLSIVYQPIFDLSANRMIAVEALARFAGMPERSPDVWFHEANVVGLGADLEKMAIDMALASIDDLPDKISMAVNISPQHVLNGTFASALGDRDLSRVTLEITEHAEVVSYQELADVLKPLRAAGLQVAVDDAGAGYASFRHILNLAPDRIKLDISITKNIDADPFRRALAAAFMRFSAETGSRLIAEGVETVSELDTLQELGIDSAQGFFLSKPLSLAGIIEMGLSVPDAVKAQVAQVNYRH